MLTDGLASLLAGEPTITAIIGTPATRAAKPMLEKPATTGIFLQQLPEGAPLPVIVFMQTEGVPIADSMDGADPLHEARIAFTPQAKTARMAKLLQVTLRRFLEGYRGTLVDGTEIDSVVLASELDAFEYTTFTFHAPIDFRILYRDTGSLQA